MAAQGGGAEPVRQGRSFPEGPPEEDNDTKVLPGSIWGSSGSKRERDDLTGTGQYLRQGGAVATGGVGSGPPRPRGKSLQGGGTSGIKTDTLMADPQDRRGAQPPPAAQATRRGGPSTSRDRNAVDDMSPRKANREAVKKYRQRKKEEERALSQRVEEVKNQVKGLEERIDTIKTQRSKEHNDIDKADILERMELKHLRDLKRRMIHAFSLSEDQESVC